MVRSGSDAVARWRERLLRFPNAGLTVKEFCRQEGVSTPAFYAWRKRLGSRPAAESNSRQPAPAFQALQVIPTLTATLTVRFPSGIRIELPADQTQAIRTVMTELMRAQPPRGQS